MASPSTRAAASPPRGSLVPYHGVLGVTDDGVVAYSNGNEDFFSKSASIAFDMRLQFSHAFRVAAEKAMGGGGKTASQATTEFAQSVEQLGIKWQCVEFARRYWLQTQGLWLRSVPIAENIWRLDTVTSLLNGEKVLLLKHANGKTSTAPRKGDLLVWQRARDLPFGHVAAIVRTCIEEVSASPPSDSPGDEKKGTKRDPRRVLQGYIEVAEQNHTFEDWQGKAYSRRIPVAHRSDGVVELIDEDPLLGWISPFGTEELSFNTHDIADNFRSPISSGYIQRFDVPRDPSLGWLKPAQPCDFFLKRSLVIDGNMGEGAQADPKDTPDGYYVMDLDMFLRIRKAAHSLHDLALKATWTVLSDPDAPMLLEHYFGVPRELHSFVRKSLRYLPAMTGRFDLGYDGERLIMLEYNCDSSAAFYECCDTQNKWAEFKGGECAVGHSSGSFLNAKAEEYFAALRENALLCPPAMLIHFMVDDDDEERYTALAVAQCAQRMGFRVKICVKLIDFKFQPVTESPSNDVTSSSQFVDLGRVKDESPNRTRRPTFPATADLLGSTGDDTGREYLRCNDIVDLDGERVELVWKTWSWDTVLHQYTNQRDERRRQSQSCEPSSEGNPSQALPLKPTLSDILLNEKIHTIEPFWKMITGSKALLPFMHNLSPEHPNMVYATFERTPRLLRHHHLSKPVNGRAGQNITMYDPIACSEEHRIEAHSSSDAHPQKSAHKTCVNTFLCKEPEEDSALGDGDGRQSSDVMSPSTPYGGHNEKSGGKFFDSLVVYQERVKLKRFSDKYYPIFCAWIVGDQFGGVVIREDTSKITKLGSIVAPCRVIRK